jgi:hypothetical protein
LKFWNYKTFGLKNFWLLAFSVIVWAVPVFGQETDDSAEVIIGPRDSLTLNPKNVVEIVYDTLENRPGTAALYSAVLPGLGQAYNKKYWKMPLIYGGGLVVGYYINYNHQLYKQYRDGLYAIIDEDDRTEPFNPNLSEENYRNQTSYWGRNRDLLIIAAIVLYAANIIDAHVDAHLALFNVDEDISVKLEPCFDHTAMQTNLYGISLKIKFN